MTDKNTSPARLYLLRRRYSLPILVIACALGAIAERARHGRIFICQPCFSAGYRSGFIDGNTDSCDYNAWGDDDDLGGYEDHLWYDGYHGGYLDGYEDGRTRASARSDEEGRA